MRSECPNCDSYDTERVHVEWMSDLIEETRICNDCPAQYTISLGNPVVEDLSHPKEWTSGGEEA